MFDDLRGVALDVTFDLLGIDITITRPEVDALPVTTQGVWQLPLDESDPIGVDRKRRDPRRVMVIRRSGALPELVRETRILAAELDGGEVKTWRVDGFEQAVEPDVVRPILVQIPTA